MPGQSTITDLGGLPPEQWRTTAKIGNRAMDARWRKGIGMSTDQKSSTLKPMQRRLDDLVSELTDDQRAMFQAAIDLLRDGMDGDRVEMADACERVGLGDV